MYDYKSVCADNKNGIFENIIYISEILELITKYKHVLIDDYYSKDNIAFINEQIDLINSLYPHFYAVTKNKKFIGFAYLYDWYGGHNEVHSCTLTTCFKPEYWGEDVMLAANDFIKRLFETLKIKKLKAEVFGHNHKVKNLLKQLGFKKEGILRNETMKSGKPINVHLYSLIRQRGKCGEKERRISSSTNYN